MSKIPDDLLYSEEHEYLKAAGEDDVYTVGITDYAQGELGDIVFVELPSVGDSFARSDVLGTIEAVKAVSDLYSPLSGEIVAVNDALDGDPSIINNDPYGDGWIVRLRIRERTELDQLLGAQEYAAHIGEG